MAPTAALPAGLTARGFGSAWLIAFAAHGLLIVIWFGLHGRMGAPEAPLVRLVFVEPAPPPAAPLGAPTGSGTTPTIAAPSEPAPEKAVEPKPVSAEGERLRRFDAQARPKPEPKLKSELRRAKPAPRDAKPPSTQVAPGVAQGAVGGEAMGVVGGVAVGIAGGTVGGTGSGPLRLSEVARAPTLVRRVEPVYPAMARRREIQGLVLLEGILDREGKLEPDIKVLESIPLLDDEAIAAVRQWRFRPAQSRDGAPVRVILEIPIRFVLR